MAYTGSLFHIAHRIISAYFCFCFLLFFLSFLLSAPVFFFVFGTIVGKGQLEAWNHMVSQLILYRALWTAYLQSKEERKKKKELIYR
jgi:hypothetical protein